MTRLGPLPKAAAWKAVARCVAASGPLLVRRRIHLPRGQVGRWLRFTDGSSAVVYRETTLDGPPPRHPCVLVVTFRLRWVRGHGHLAFRAESILNTPLFVGFPGFVSKLWLAHDADGRYRGLYEWDGPGRAEAYARALWRVLAIVSEPASIDYQVLPGPRRDEVLAGPPRAHEEAPEARTWWRVVETA
jgi:hypothetical protein